MRTKAEAEAALARLPLTIPVSVADLTTERGARRSYSYANVYIEIDADPSDAQLGDLANHLPLAGKDRAPAFAAFKAAVGRP